MRTLTFSAPLLAIDASTAAGSVALWRDDVLVAHEDVVMGAGPDDRLFPSIQGVLRQAGLTPSDVRCIVCGAGPGSFTSLRIAAALAKGLAHGAGAALYAVPSLLLAAASVAPMPDIARTEGLVVHADALRGERYALPVRADEDGMVIAAGPLARISAADLAANIPGNRRVSVLASPFDDERAPVVPHMRHLPRVGGAWRQQPVSLEAWEPEYGRLAEAQVKWEERHGMALPETPAIRA